MSIAFGIGAISGVLAVMVVVLIKKKINPKKNEYDERQVAARGTAFRAGFVTFVICELSVFIAELVLNKPLLFIAPGFLSIIIVLVSTLVFVEVSIFKDAYFTPDKPFSKRWFILMLFFGLLAIAQFIHQDEAWYKYMNLACGIFILSIMASIIIKLLISKKAEKDDELSSSDE